MVWHAPDAYTVAHAKKLSIALEQLARHAYDVVLLDLGLPDSDGLETLERFRKVRPSAASAPPSAAAEHSRTSRR